MHAALTDRIEQTLRQWPQWSPAERATMDAIGEEILAHVRDGGGNRFLAQWCDRNLRDVVADARA
jgi:hypothetical protein